MTTPRRAVLALTLAAALFAVAGSSPALAKTTWLCKPGLAKNPCTPGLSTTFYSPAETVLRVERPKVSSPLRADCFYVYPTVSDQKTTLANFKVDPEIRSIALYQAARFSQRCRVFAPMYRQVTIKTLTDTGTETAAQLATGVGDVRSAFRDYLAHYNRGRPFVLIGHSQGSFVLRTLIAKDVDAKPAVRRLMLSALLLGGNVKVKKGKGIGGDFQHVPACRSNRQLGCVVAFSTFDTPVPDDTKFGGTRGSKTTEVLCTNPAALGGGSGLVKTIFPAEPFAPGTTIAIGIQLLGLTLPKPDTIWGEQTAGYSARCSSANNAHVLQITPRPGAQVPKPSPDKTWGLHLMDANIAMGNLVDLVGTQTTAFFKRAAG